MLVMFGIGNLVLSYFVEIMLNHKSFEADSNNDLGIKKKIHRHSSQSSVTCCSINVAAL